MYYNAITITSSSAVYRFWSSCNPRVTKYLATILSIWLDNLYAIILLIPISPYLLEVLVAIIISVVFLAAVIITS
jgi:hypothetical protein